jgi:hypothetical protein
VIPQPITQKIHYIYAETKASSVKLSFELGCLLGKRLVLLLMLGRLRIAELVKIFLFRLEMERCIAHKATQNLSQHLFSFSAPHGIVQLVDHLDKLLMLSVDFAHVDGQIAIPLNQHHAPISFLLKLDFSEGYDPS